MSMLNIICPRGPRGSRGGMPREGMPVTRSGRALSRASTMMSARGPSPGGSKQPSGGEKEGVQSCGVQRKVRLGWVKLGGVVMLRRGG